jgi:dTDP-4-dehydrorhamnose 3,5-epimerase-like enzyme
MPATTFSRSSAPQIGTNWYQTPLAGLYYGENPIYRDQRGFYTELSLIPDLEPVIQRPFTIQQLNLSHSEARVTRGFHAEQWSKLVTIISGEAFCAFADIRPDSPTFGQVLTMMLGKTESTLPGCLFIPPGIANSVCVTSGPVDYFYAVDALYRDRDKQHDVAISLFDPDLGVIWPFPADQLILSDRDKQAVTLRTKFPGRSSYGS